MGSNVSHFPKKLLSFCSKLYYNNIKNDCQPFTVADGNTAGNAL
jgi:hypothetical protein